MHGDFHLSVQELSTYTHSVFLKMGFTPEKATEATACLLMADLRGIDSHGVARLSGYVRLWEKGRINASATTSILRETPSTATLDGDAGLGLNIGQEAMRMAIAKAKNCGTGWVAVQHSNHFGIAAFHAMMALEEDMIGMAMTNASPLVAPTFSTERMLGTNPVCYAIPTGKHPAFVLDMATSAAANGKLEIAQRKKQQVPEGWIQNKEGNSELDPDGLKKGGSLLPLGSDREHGSHKGFGLSAVVDIFCGVLSGANYGPWVPPFVAFLNPSDNPVGKGLGHFFGAMRIDAFRPASEFKRHMDTWIDRFKTAQPINPDQPVVIPGEPEYLAHLQRKEQGIPLHADVRKDLIDLAEKLGLKHPF